ncbi:MAG: peptidase C39 family protein [Candidatus Thermoplasmatota archaeon]|jgi:ABC-type bacteriocin/lantibiotic exporter with double-glycine peptidase domain|nr:peptidase C39 family protein [Candidatus Thermoplasmatota archaeon]MCK5300353.1 peptidase C39 family protein [Thermoplasmatales archaeon]
MDNPSENNNKINVPYFQQTRYSTCGVASLMMVMKYWDNSIKLSRNEEFFLWMKSNPFIFLGGTLQFGLAKTALKYGFKVHIYQKSKFSNIYPNKHKLIDFYEWVASYGARHKKIPIQYNKNILEEIFISITENIPPIVFINLKPIIGENVLHWLVVTGINKEKIYVNDPYIPYGSSVNQKKNIIIELDIFKKAIATDKSNGLRLPPCIIKIFR